MDLFSQSSLYHEHVLWVHMDPAEVEYVVLAAFTPCPNS